MKRFHLLYGIIVIIIFLLTGQYMDRYLQHLSFLPNDARLFYRSRHIYILLSGLVNLGIGSYFVYQVERWRRVLQVIGSVLMAIASLLFVLAFIFEPRRMSFETVFTGFGMYSIVAGTLLHLIASWRRTPAG